MTKEDTIKTEYKKIGLPFHENVLYDNGWLRIKPSQYSSKYDKVDLLKLTDHTHSIRPKSLNGINDNNGWIKINSDDELPKESSLYWIMRNNDTISNLNDYETDKKYMFPELQATHYQRIIKPNKPIY